MKVISKDRNRITLFSNGVWLLNDTEILLSTNHIGIAIVFSEYDTKEEAKREFEAFMNHAENESVFDFSKTH